MDTIDLECPRCRESLSLDAGFAGGVCRCSNCGTLMTVPASTNQQAEEVVRRSRPSRPGAPTEETSPRPERPQRPDRPARPQAPGVEPATDETTQAEPDEAETPSPAETAPEATQSDPTSDLPDTSSKRRPGKEKTKKGDRKRSRKNKQEDEAKPPTVEVVQETDELVTASGQKIELAVGQTIPTASKRKLLIARIGTIAVVGGFVLILTIVCIVAIVSMARSTELSGPTAEERRQAELDRAAELARMNFRFNPGINPFTLSQPNAMGFSIRGRTLVLVDASSDAEAWLPLISEALVAGLQREPALDAEVEVVYANTDVTHSVSRAANGFLSEENAQVLMDAEAAGDPDLLPALEAALNMKPEQVVLITASEVRGAGDIESWEAALDKLRAQVTSEEAVNDEIAERAPFVFNALMIAGDDFDWDFLTRSYDGRYHWHPLARLRDWQQNYAYTQTEDVADAGDH